MSQTLCYTKVRLTRFLTPSGRNSTSSLHVVWSNHTVHVHVPKTVNADWLIFLCPRRTFLIVNNSYYIWVPIIVGLLAVVFAGYLANFVLRKDTGTPAMQKVADAIFKGAMAFLNRQYRRIGILAVG